MATVRRRGGSTGGKIAALAVALLLAAGLIWWAIGQGQRTQAYYERVCPHGHIIVHGFGYCLDEDKNPYIPKEE